MSPLTYAIRVDGHLDDHWSAWLGGLTITRNRDATTTLTGPLADQAQLHGALTALRDIGATLLDLRTTDRTGTQQPPMPAELERALRTERLTLRPAAPGPGRPPGPDGDRPAGITGQPDPVTDPGRLAASLIVQLGHDPAAAVIGSVRLHRGDAPGEPGTVERARGTVAELSWRFDDVHNGQMYAAEAVQAVLRHGLEDLGLRRITAACLFEDEPSWRLMEQVGLRREVHAVRAYLHRSGRWLDILGYAVLAEEWPVPRPTSVYIGRPVDLPEH